MHIITRKRLNEFVDRHPDAFTGLDEWYRKAKRVKWQNFAEVKANFRTADLVGKYVVFNIGGNKFRLIASVRYQRQTHDRSCGYISGLA